MDYAFDRSRAENDLHDVMMGLGIGSWIAESEVPGVVVYVCDDLFDEDAILDAMEAKGHKVEQVQGCTWITDDGDEDVVAVAFDCPELPDDWRLDLSSVPGHC